MDFYYVGTLLYIYYIPIGILYMSILNRYIAKDTPRKL